MGDTWTSRDGKPKTPCRRMLSKGEFGSWDSVSLGLEAEPGLEGPHMSSDGIFALS